MGPACVALAALRSPLAERLEIEILDPGFAGEASDRAILDAIEERRPHVLGLALYVWNLVRSLWIAREAKRRVPGLAAIAGGPEVVPGRSELFDGGLDAAVPGEGEVPFRGFLARLLEGADPRRPESLAGVPGLLLAPLERGGEPFSSGPAPPPPALDELGSPYVAGLLDAARDRFLYLETARGCRFRCAFCRYDAERSRSPRRISLPRVRDVLDHAAEKRVEEIFLLDPTLNDRPDAAEFFRALAGGNPGPPAAKLFRYGGELVAELVEPETADLMARAGFHTVEAGLQSTNPETLRLVGRFRSPERFLRGARLLEERGIRVRADLILGLPGETLESAKRAIDFVAGIGPGTEPQVFELMVLPGTALAERASELGIEHLRRPPYTVVRTPTLSEEDLIRALAYSEEVFGVSWTPEPALRELREEERIEVDRAGSWRERLRDYRRNYLALDARALPHARASEEARRALASFLAENPFASADVLLRAEAPGDLAALERLVEAVQAPDGTLGAAVRRRVWTFLPSGARERLGRAWLERAARLSIIRDET